MMKHNIASSLAALALLAAGCLACSATPSDGLNLAFVESTAEIESMASFIEIGETTGNQLLSKLGRPFVVSNHEGGQSQFNYMWRTTPYAIDAVEDKTVSIYDPEQGGHPAQPRSESDTAHLVILLGENNIVQDVVFYGSNSIAVQPSH